MSIFALGVTPFLSALLIFEFIKLIVPPLARWETADPDNARRLSRYPYFLALIMAGLQANGLANALYGITGLIDGPGWETIIAITLIAGTMLLGWFGDRITVRGLGNGFWLLLITPTLVGLPSAALGSVELLQRGAVTPTAFFAAVVFLVVAVALVAATCLAGARSEHRVSGTGFAGVWPPMFANYISGFVVVFFSIAAGGAIHLILIAVLIAMFSWLQSLAISKEASRPIWTIALVQILICCGSEFLTHKMNPPFAINGSWLDRRCHHRDEFFAQQGADGLSSADRGPGRVQLRCTAAATCFISTRRRGGRLRERRRSFISGGCKSTEPAQPGKAELS